MNDDKLMKGLRNVCGECNTVIEYEDGIWTHIGPWQYLDDDHIAYPKIETDETNPSDEGGS